MRCSAMNGAGAVRAHGGSPAIDRRAGGVDDPPLSQGGYPVILLILMMVGRTGQTWLRGACTDNS